MNSFMPTLNKFVAITALTVVSLLTSMFVPLTGILATQNSMLRLDTVAKNVTTGTAYGDSTNAQLGDTVRVRINLENLTSADLNDIAVKAQLPSTASSSINVIGTAQSSVVGFLSDPTPVNLTSGTGFLNYIPGTTKVAMINGTVNSQPDVNGTGPVFTFAGLNVGLHPGANSQFFVYFDAKVTSTPQTKPALNIQFTKDVHNLTQNTAFGSTSTAKDGDVIEYRLFVHNGGCTDGSCGDYPATGVVLKDVLSVSGTTAGNTATFNSNEAGPFTASASVAIPSGATVSYVAGSTKMVNPNDSSVNAIADVNGTSPLYSANGLTFDEGQGAGVLPYCNQFRRYILYQVKVTVPTTPTPTPTPPAVLGTTTLPNTGPETGVQILLAGLVPAGLILRRFKL